VTVDFYGGFLIKILIINNITGDYTAQEKRQGRKLSVLVIVTPIEKNGGWLGVPEVKIQK